MEDSELLNILYLHNPWWTGKKPTLPNKKRAEFSALWSALSTKQIMVLIGPRRTGKSILMQQLIQQLLAEKTDPKKILFTQLDEPIFGKEKSLIIQRILEIYSKYIVKSDLDCLSEKIYIFFDEIQQVEKWSEQLKSYYDKRYSIKFAVSGSSAAGITRGSSESLAGRVSLNLLSTLKFADYLRFKDCNNKLSNQITQIQTVLAGVLETKDLSTLSKTLTESYNRLIPYHGQIEIYLSEFMIKGGYIELLEIENYPKCAKYLKDLLQLVFYKDIVKVFGIRNPKKMEDLMLYLANHSAELFSETSASPKLKMKQETIGEYIKYLQAVFLINSCMIYAKNKAKQLRNPKKIYISDNGLRNVLNGTYDPQAMLNARDVGLMAETVVHNHIQSLASQSTAYQSNCYYWKNNHEIDNILVCGQKPIPIEVKYQNELSAKDAEGCLEFAEKNASPYSIIITKNKFAFKNNIAYIPLWYFLLLC
jgi:predicted AAA+ superfamily ATPase